MSRNDIEGRVVKPHSFRSTSHERPLERECRWCKCTPEQLEDNLVSEECAALDPVERLFLDEIALLDAGAAAYVRLAEHLEGRADVARSKARILITQRETLTRSMPPPLATAADAA